MTKIVIRKIFYNQETRDAIAPPFLPLDNCDGPAGWFELWPILKFLESETLEDDVWYGFVSPKFPEKAEITYDQVAGLIAENPEAEVALFTYNWVRIGLNRNVWTESNFHHPGLTGAMEGFLRSQGDDTRLDEVFCTFETAVFSNYIVAKRRFWDSWRKLARSYVDHVENGGADLPDNQPSTHAGTSSYMVKTFVQERLSTWLLMTERFGVVHPDYTRDIPLPALLQSKDSRWLRWLIRTANTAKGLYLRTGFRGWLIGYKIARRLALPILRRED
jgi:hypothetical protein